MSTRSISLSGLWISAGLLAACGKPADIQTSHHDLVLVGADGAIAIDDGRFVQVGGDVDPDRIGPETRVIELGERAALPGLVDAHCHLYGLGKSLENVTLRGVASEAEAVKIVVEAAAARGPGEWVLGRGWDQNLWGGEFPTRASLDAAVTDHPVALRRVDGHAVWVNTRALELAGVTRDTADPQGGRILRDDAGEPTGVLVDNAMDLVEARIPAATDEVRERWIRAGAAYAIERGLTGVHDMGLEPETIAVYERLADAGELPLRVNAYVEGSPAVARELRERRPTRLDDGDDWLQIRGMKLYADGALGSRGAALSADYSDEPGNRGNWVTAPAELRQAILDATAGGWQVAVHAIGDAAIHAVLDAYEEAQHPELRLRVEHVQVIAADDVPRFARLGVLASMQPTHATSDMPWAEERVGADRILGAYAWRTLLDAGATLVHGSDFPVEEVSPLLGLYAAVTRQDASGNPPGGWYPAQRMTLDEAIRGFTEGAAYAGFVEGSRGRIQAGMVADLTVLDRAIAADRSLLDARVDLTIVGGKIVFEREGAFGD